MNIRQAQNEDVPRIIDICGEARSFMRSDGNMTQWTGGYPSEETIKADIARSVGFVIEIDGLIEGYFAFISGIEPTYLKIYDGEWLENKSRYSTIHRLASSRSSRGVAKACFVWCWERCCNLRVDTHEDNRIMRHCIESFGFTYCGIIHLEDGTPRLAYQKIASNA